MLFPEQSMSSHLYDSTNIAKDIYQNQIKVSSPVDKSISRSFTVPVD